MYVRETSVEFDAQQREVWAAMRELNQDGRRARRRAARKARFWTPHDDEQMLPLVGVEAARSYGRAATRHRNPHAPSAVPPPPSPFADLDSNAYESVPPKRTSFGITGRTISASRRVVVPPRPSYSRVSASTVSLDDDETRGDSRCACEMMLNRCPVGPVS